MTTKEAIDITQNEKECNYCVNSEEYQALQKLISLAEQVEGVMGISDVSTNSRCPDDVLQELTVNHTNARWRALIVGRANEAEKIVKNYGCELYKLNGISMLTAIRNLFLGGGK